jgi:hypothetical protein
MYARLGATAAPALSTADQAKLAAGVQALPSCYDAKFHECWYRDQPGAFPNCAAVVEAWKLDKERMEHLVDELPICTCPVCVGSRPSALASPMLTGTFAVLSVVLGGLLFWQVRK